MHRPPRRALAAVLGGITAVLVCAPAAAAEDQPIRATVTVDGRDVAIAATAEPIPLYPDRSIDVTVDVTNGGQTPIDIGSVQLVGKVLGLTFFSYSTGVELTVAPGATSSVQYDLDLTDLKSQATGLMDTEVVVRNPDRDVVAVVDTVADVRGSLLSVYGVLGLALLVLTTLAIIDAAIAIARHKTSMNRFRRALRLLSPGIGVGLVLAFTASVARWWVPRTGTWLLIAGITAAVFFALGYFSPTQDDSDDDDDDDDESVPDDTEAGPLNEQDTVVAATTDLDKSGNRPTLIPETGG